MYNDASLECPIGRKVSAPFVRPDPADRQKPYPHPLHALGRYKGTGDVYFATSNSAIQRAHYDSAKSPSWDVTTVVGGHVEVRVEGYNLGTSIDDAASFSVKGVECPTRRRESSNTLVCVLGDPAVTSDLGEVRHSVVP